MIFFVFFGECIWKLRCYWILILFFVIWMLEVSFCNLLNDLRKFSPMKKMEREIRSFVAEILGMDVEFEMLVDFVFVFCDLNALSLFVKFIEWFEKFLPRKWKVEKNLEVSLPKSESFLEMDMEFETLLDFAFNALSFSVKFIEWFKKILSFVTEIVEFLCNWIWNLRWYWILILVSVIWMLWVPLCNLLDDLVFEWFKKVIGAKVI